MTKIHDLTSLAECRAVVGIQHAVWGQDGETVPASILGVSAKRGGILLGATQLGANQLVTKEDARLVGFVWSMPGWREGRPTQWSHMLAVLPDARGQGLAERLKLAQRDRARDAHIELIEWTFDPLQAANAHFNFACLGTIASEYRVNAYGELTGPLHLGTPTDRLVAEWWIDRPHVLRRIEARAASPDRRADSRPGMTIVARDASVTDAPVAIETTPGEWTEVASTRTALEDRRILIPIPARFGDMQRHATAAALAWRLATREVFSAYFGRGYRAVDFFKDAAGGGAYLLESPTPAAT